MTYYQKGVKTAKAQTHDVFLSRTALEDKAKVASNTKEFADFYRGYEKEFWNTYNKKKTNPSLPKGKFIPCKAVKINRNGSVSVRL